MAKKVYDICIVNCNRGSGGKMIKVLIVEDSPVAQEFLSYILSSDPAIQVVGVANNGAEALKLVAQKKPDVITMDIHMPIMDGFEATREIMMTHPTPIVIVSGSTGATEVSSTFRAIEAGALAVVLRPPGLNHELFESSSKGLIQTLKLMSEVKVVKRIAGPAKKIAPARRIEPFTPNMDIDIQAAAIGASTGGPAAILQILSLLPEDLSFPILIVQHITSGFLNGFVDWLGNASRFPVRIASHGDRLMPGQAYVAPDAFHMGVESGPRIVLSDHAPENGLRPSVACLFRAVSQIFGPHALGVLLTGMGKDGAAELKTMKEMGAITIAQNEASSIVHGMPGEAIRLGAATHILPPEDIAAMLIALGRKRNGGTNGR
jgi:two-component system, chemotaxis family, protein-glutamate methylesterase/glutaminase